MSYDINNNIGDFDFHTFEDEYDLVEDVTQISYPVTIFANSAMVVIAVSGRSTFTFNSSHARYKDAKEFAFAHLDSEVITEDEVLELEAIYSIKSIIQNWSNGRLSIAGNSVYFDGDAVPESLENHLIKLLNQSKAIDDVMFNAWSKFIDKLRDASDVDIHNRLHLFLKHNDLGIDADGDVLAYKVVRPNYLDKHSGTIDNSVGQTPSIPRIKVDNDVTRTCSYGLHVCSFNYLKDFGSHGDPVMLVKVDVRDIVSIPIDYDGEKVRCCKYHVVKEIGKWGIDVHAGTTDFDFED